MSVFTKYFDYLKDNPENYWFRKKIYGWGWTPARWQGWLVTLAFIVFSVWSGLEMSSALEPTKEMFTWFIAKIILAVVVVLAICYKTGEKPKWQWGLPDKK